MTTTRKTYANLDECLKDGGDPGDIVDADGKRLGDYTPEERAELEKQIQQEAEKYARVHPGSGSTN